MPSDLSSRMRNTAEALVLAFDGDWDIEAILAPRADSCQHAILPASLGIPKKDNAAFAKRIGHVKHLIKDAKVKKALMAQPCRC